MAYTEFYCYSGGANINAGSDTNATALYTSTNGNFQNAGATHTFTPTDGSNPVTAGVAVGMWGSFYADGATTAVFIARITAVTNAANGVITWSNLATLGTPPSVSATGRSVKVGGAWLGPSGSSLFPFSLGSFASTNDASNHAPRVNIKNDQTYSFTANVSASPANATIQGYSSSVGDGGRATFTNSTTAGTDFTFSGQSQTFIDIIFANTGASGTNDLVSPSGAGSTFIRCVFHGGRGTGLVAGSVGRYLSCEIYDNNKSNTSGKAGLTYSGSGGSIGCFNCYFHDNTGSNTSGINITGLEATLVNCISESNGSHGLFFQTSLGGGNFSVIGCDFYNNTGAGISIANASQQTFPIIRNCNLIKNGSSGITVSLASQPGISINNGYGSGTQVNGASDSWNSVQEVGKLTYASGVTPWNAPTTGDFRIILAAAMNAGDGTFIETDGTNTGTVGYPDIGAAAALNTAGGGGAGWSGGG